MDQAGSGSGVWCVRSQGGGGRHGGAMPTDDNAAGGRAGDREPGKIRTTDPRSTGPHAATEGATPYTRSGLAPAGPSSRPEGTGQAFNRMCVRRGVVRFTVCRS
ncbi:hypothetical protein EW053_19830 [Streptomyces sp. IB2014 016-6]|nr:hypothetical protein EW053_19830 [Streptomyces sp. IB2014 016-6]